MELATIISLATMIALFIISLQQYLLNKKRFSSFKINCLSTLTNKVDNIEETLKAQWKKIDKTIEDTSNQGERIAGIEGELKAIYKLTSDALKK